MRMSPGNRPSFTGSLSPTVTNAPATINKTPATMSVRPIVPVPLFDDSARYHADMFARIAISLLAALTLWSCSSKPMPADPAYPAQLQKWRTDREARLKADDGWLTLVGLYWIEPGVSKIGSDPAADVPLPDKLPKQLGSLKLEGKVAEFKPAPGVPLQPVTLHDDNVEDYETVSLDTVRFYLIQRGGRFGIRVKDSQSPARVNFKGLDWYQPDPSWVVDAKFSPAPHKVTFDTEVGVKQEDESPGYVEFEHAGQNIKLEPVKEGDELFFVVRDATSGKTTYAASRFLYSGLPKDGHVQLDFNKLYNPPCVFHALRHLPAADATESHDGRD